MLDHELQFVIIRLTDPIHHCEWSVPGTSLLAKREMRGVTLDGDTKYVAVKEVLVSTMPDI